MKCCLLVLLFFSSIGFSVRDALSASTRLQPGGDLDSSVKPMRAVIDRWHEDLQALHRRYQGPDSKTREERLGRFYQEHLDKLQQLDFSGLDVEGRIDFVLLKTKCEL